MNLFRDRDDLQQEELAASLQVGRGSLDHGGESRMTPHHAKILHILFDIHQGAEEFLKTPEGAKMLKTSRKAEEEDQEENGEVGGLELQEATDVESETVDEEKGAENYKRRKTLFDLIVMQSNFE